MKKLNFKMVVGLLTFSCYTLIINGCQSENQEPKKSERASNLSTLPTDEEISKTILEIYEINITSRYDESDDYISKLPLIITPYHYNPNSEPFIVRTLFPGTNQDFLVKQSAASEDFSPDSVLIKKLNIKSLTDSCVCSYNTISVPLYSKDRRMILIYESYGWGYLSGYAYDRIYRKTTNGWELFTTLSYMRS